MAVSQFKAGMYLLETLTSGMYNDPLSIYREYIQNSVDSIDQSGQSPEDAVIRIELNPIKQSVRIFDNGDGIRSEKAERTLSSIGSSEKLGTMQRGFRGIGRLGGIAFAKMVVFRTTAKGESVVSTQEWNCDELRKLLSSPDHTSMTIEELFSKVSSFSQEHCDEFKDVSFFEVKLLEVESYQNFIFDIQKIKKYLVQVAPLPFNSKVFSFHGKIQSYLSENVPQYGEYKITVNGQQLYRPYADDLSITSKQRSDLLESVELFTLKDGDTFFAHGWYGCRRDLLGSIKKGAAASGLRIKVGNIQVGGQHLLDRCFREDRFNSYSIGEIHVCNQSLLPNSRRDDFIDNKEKTLLYNLIEREIGLPLSKEIRHKSRLRTKSSKPLSSKKVVASPLKANIQHDEKKIEIVRSVSEESSSVILEKLFKECGDCKTLQRILENLLN
jgi:hypothetical protein